MDPTPNLPDDATNDAAAASIPTEQISTDPIAVGNVTAEQTAAEEVLSAQVETLEAATQTSGQFDNSEVRARVQHLVGLIKRNLRSRTLPPNTQRELARLLSLTSRLDNRHVQQLNLLDLAVSTLLESDQSDEGETTSGSSTGKDRFASKAVKNLVFVRETRRQIATQSRAYPNIVRSIFVPGDSTPYIRLISGLSWFFFIFVLTPLALSGTVLLTREVARDIVDYEETKQQVAALADENKALLQENSEKQDLIDDLISRQDALRAQLGNTGSKLEDLKDRGEIDAAKLESPVAAGNRLVLTQGEIEDLIRDIDTELRADKTTQQAIEETPTVDESATDTSTPEALTSTGSAQPSLSVPDVNTAARVKEITASTVDTVNDLVTDRFSLILLAVSMGALGSTISVIVRANTFIQQAQETDSDLFLTGFFRPFVGMSFAIFCVALVEAGIFSGLFNFDAKENDDRVYFYVAIAFVAGFSERLVRDVVIKTEDTLAGPAPRK